MADTPRAVSQLDRMFGMGDGPVPLRQPAHDLALLDPLRRGPDVAVGQPEPEVRLGLPRHLLPVLVRDHQDGLIGRELGRPCAVREEGGRRVRHVPRR